MTVNDAILETRRRMKGINDMLDRYNNPAAAEELKKDMDYYKCALDAITPKGEWGKHENADNQPRLFQ